MLRSAERYDAIVVGAGHNGLVCAAMLAKKGKSVLVLEAESDVGGAAVTREFADGYSVSGCAHLLYQLQPRVCKALGVEPAYAAENIATIVLSTEGDVVRYGAGTAAGVGDADVESYRAFDERMQHFARFLNRQLMRVPPSLGPEKLRDWAALARLGADLRLLGREDLREFLRMVAMNVRDELVERFESPALRGGIACDAVLGTHLGPRSPGTILTYLYRLSAGGALCQPAGGMGSLTARLAQRAEALGVRILTGRPVSRIAVDNGRVVGVECADGESFASLTVVSNADPKRTVMELAGARHFETRFVHRVQHLRSAGDAAKLHLALDGLPAVPGLERRDYGSRLLIAPDEEYVERAFNPAKYGEFSPQPVVELTFPSFLDATLAPPGKHVLSAVVTYAPHGLRGGWTPDARGALLRAIMNTLSAYMPEIEERVVASELLTPVDIEERHRITGGHWHHAELAFDQFLFVRPVAGAARYKLPLDGLFLCGAGAHPGGGVSGAAGYNAARAVLSRESIA